MKEKDRKALKEWEEIKASILNATTIDSSLSPYEIEKKRQWLEAHPIEWMKYFFPHSAAAVAAGSAAEAGRASG